MKTKKLLLFLSLFSCSIYKLSTAEGTTTSDTESALATAYSPQSPHKSPLSSPAHKTLALGTLANQQPFNLSALLFSTPAPLLTADEQLLRDAPCCPNNPDFFISFAAEVGPKEKIKRTAKTTLEKFILSFSEFYNIPVQTLTDIFDEDELVKKLAAREFYLATITTVLEKRMAQLKKESTFHEKDFAEKQNSSRMARAVLEADFEKIKIAKLEKLTADLMAQESKLLTISDLERQKTILEEAYKLSLSKEVGRFNENESMEFLESTNEELGEPLVKTTTAELLQEPTVLSPTIKSCLPVLVGRALTEISTKAKLNTAQIIELKKGRAQLRREITNLEQKKYPHLPNLETEEYGAITDYFKEEEELQRNAFLYTTWATEEKEIIRKLKEAQACLIFLNPIINATHQKTETLRTQITRKKEFIEKAPIYITTLKQLLKRTLFELEKSYIKAEACSLFATDFIKDDFKQRLELIELLKTDLEIWERLIKAEKDSLSFKQQLL